MLALQEKRLSRNFNSFFPLHSLRLFFSPKLYSWALFTSSREERKACVCIYGRRSVDKSMINFSRVSPCIVVNVMPWRKLNLRELKATNPAQVTANCGFWWERDDDGMEETNYKKNCRTTCFFYVLIELLLDWQKTVRFSAKNEIDKSLCKQLCVIILIELHNNALLHFTTRLHRCFSISIFNCTCTSLAFQVQSKTLLKII